MIWGQVYNVFRDAAEHGAAVLAVSWRIPTFALHPATRLASHVGTKMC
jgi:hypothetical protein